MGKIINFFEDHIVIFFVLISIVSTLLMLFIPFKSFRNLTSDVITIISITLAIDGLFLGILINLRDDSPFFKRASKYNLEDDIFRKLMKSIVHNIYFNVFFIVITLVYDVMPPFKMVLLKRIGNIVWMSFFFFLLIGTVHIVYLINKINNFKPEKSDTKLET
ncbi:hypothetical protein AAHB45_01615 [Pediococcus pentosaceus]|uniref:hypothetical protein n=1 Tax=Pediococcus pentosaceus TaxID=1255 RepID=UPI0031652CC1